MELVYTTERNNPILGRCYEDVDHLAHALRKVADGRARRHRRAEERAARQVPNPVMSGLREKTVSVIPDTADHDAPQLRFVSKHVAYEDVLCPACHTAMVQLMTRKCPGCQVMIPHGAEVRLPDVARERLWTRAVAQARRKAAAGSVAESAHPDDIDSDDALNHHPHESMLPYVVSAPWTRGLQAAYRAGVQRRVNRRKSVAQRVDEGLNVDEDARSAEGNKVLTFDHLAQTPAYVLGVNDEDSTGAEPARPVHRRRHPAAPIPEPLTPRQRLDRALSQWRLILALEGTLVSEYEAALAALRVPRAYRRRRPGTEPDCWPTPPPAASDIPRLVQRYRARTVLIAAHAVVTQLTSLAEAAGSQDTPPELLTVPAPPTKTDLMRAEALLMGNPDFGMRYDAARCATTIRLAWVGWIHAVYSLDYESYAREVGRLHRIEAAGRSQEGTGGRERVWWTTHGRYIARWCSDQRKRFRSDLRAARICAASRGW